MGRVIIVCGGRYFDREKVIYDFLDELDKDCHVSTLVHGDCPSGADLVADQWAKSRRKNRVLFPANWEGEGKPAGHNRNERMISLLKVVHLVVAFPGGPGTSSMKKAAERAGIPVVTYPIDLDKLLDG